MSLDVYHATCQAATCWNVQGGHNSGEAPSHFRSAASSQDSGISASLRPSTPAAALDSSSRLPGADSRDSSPVGSPRRCQDSRFDHHHMASDSSRSTSPPTFANLAAGRPAVGGGREAPPVWGTCLMTVALLPASVLLTTAGSWLGEAVEAQRLVLHPVILPSMPVVLLQPQHKAETLHPATPPAALNAS